jgi:hypothetical protein
VAVDALVVPSITADAADTAETVKTTGQM